MVNPQLSLLDLTVEAGIGRCDAELIGGKNIVSVPHHDGLLVDMVNDSIEDESSMHVTRIRIQHVTRIRI